MAVGCGNKAKSPDGGSGGSGGGGGGGGQHDMAGSTSIPDLTSGDLTQGPPPPTTYTRRGLINIIDNAGSTNINAHFWDFPAGACTVTHYGACEIDGCAAGTTASAELDAGTITLGGGTSPEALMFGGTAYGAATPAIAPGTLNWAIGSTVSVSAAGKTVPAFATSVTIPADITKLTTPMLGASITIPRDQDMALAWTGGGGQFLVEIVKNTTIGPSLLCSFSANAQAGTIPKEALTAMPAGSYELELFTADLKTLPTTGGFIHVAGASFFQNVPAMLP
jgi:hypothetical protein